MEIGTIPEKKEKLSAIPLNLYSIEYTAYNQFHKEFLFLENSKQIVPTVFEKTACFTTEYHYVAEFTSVKPNQKILDTDGYLVTFLMYNEVGKYFTHTPNMKDAWEDAKNNVHPSIEKIILNRYRLIKAWRKEFRQPFDVQLINFKDIYLKK